MTPGRIVRSVGGVLLAGLVVLAAANALLAASRDHAVADERLSAADVALVQEAQRVRLRHGELVWPGFGSARVGMLVYNDRYEFLFGDIPPGWELIDGVTEYGRRPATDPQAFAVDLGPAWAGSLPTEERMDRDYLLGMREALPPVVAQLFPVWLVDIAPDQWTVSMVHEQLHAFQATTAAERFTEALDVYALEDAYPYDDDAFASAWGAEGDALRAALDAATDVEACDGARAFLGAREARRASADLSDRLIAYEQDLEWLEGLAKFAETRTYEAAASEPDGASRGYGTGLPHWTGELARLGPDLGRLDGDLRFYISGMAQARLLDRLDGTDAWRSELHSLVLETALGEACGAGG